MTRSRIRSSAPAYLTPSPSPRELSPDPPSCQTGRGGDSNNMASSSRPVSLAPSIGSRLPSLQDILTDSAPQPYTLGAFMAFLSQNHCLETLEFTMEADRYRLAYSQAARHNSLDYGDHVCGLWQKLIQAYIQQYATREVNLPSHVRHHLLSLPCGPAPPHPSELDEAVKIVYELMSDSVLVPFVESFNTNTLSSPDLHFPEQLGLELKQHRRSRSRSSKDMTSRDDSNNRSPRASFLPHLSISMSRRNAEPPNSRSVSSSTTSGVDGPPEDVAMAMMPLTDDSGTSSPPTMEPMTPPTTPPTPEWAASYSAPPGSLHKAISAHSNGWKKVSAKLGLGRRARSTHRSTTSSTTSAARPAAAATPDVPQNVL